jgi:mannose-1-phosphate guanylyltransferase
MNIILLSGGSGKRLWPLSNDIRSKQFIRIFRSGEGDLESMVQRVYRQIIAVDPSAQVTLATSKKQVSAIKNHLGDKVNVCVEPSRRDTFPAICLAASYLYDVKGLSEKEPVVVCPVDPFVDNSYFEALKELSALAGDGGGKLFLLGMKPTYPSEKYGYIIPECDVAECATPKCATSECAAAECVIPKCATAECTAPVSRVSAFLEKPDVATASSCLKQGALWNGGVFAFRLGFLLEWAHKVIDFTDYQDLYEKYPMQEKISFDYAVAEKEPDIWVMRYAGEWKDLGTWNTFTEAMEETGVGNVYMSEACENTHAVNELNIPMLCMGCKDMVIAASSDGILIADKEQSSHIKPYVEQMEQQIMYAEKSWGSFTVLDVQEEGMTIKIVLLPGNGLHYHSHEYRDEVWTIISGYGRVILDGEEKTVAPGDVVSMAAGCKHTLIADTMLQVIEVQLGKDISVEDKTKHELM